MISNKLLSEIMGSKVDGYFIDGSWIGIQYEDACNECLTRTINIYEFSNKCKEWVNNNFNTVIQLDSKSGRAISGFMVNVHDFDTHVSKEFLSETEPEAIFKACQWILENKEQK